mgnify:FL=1
MNLREETEFILKKYGLRANKKLGQNFLINEEIINQIIEKADVNKNDTIIEIGPGLGSLTAKLLENANKVIAIELDSNMSNILKERFCLYDNFELIEKDVLKVDLNEIVEKYDSVKVVANLPYYITTPIIMKLLEERLKLKSITVMVQKEVGERFCAVPNSKEYGAITISINYYTKPEIIIDVPKENFEPMPEVDSCVIKLDVRKVPPVELKNEKDFFNLIKAGFSQRRKTINNSLASMGISKEKIKNVLEKLGIDSKLRAENLTMEQFADISNNM